jgi:hypothetical protein
MIVRFFFSLPATTVAVIGDGLDFVADCCSAQRLFERIDRAVS